MIRRSGILLALLLAAVRPAAAYDDVFDQAQAAYDDGRFAESVLLYESLLEKGIDNPELHYNLANAYFKDSDLPHAVLHYRTAWHAAPRDPDIQANLRFALSAAGAVEPVPRLTERLFTSLSKNEWLAIAATGYLLLFLFLIVAVCTARARRTALKLALAAVGLLAVSAGGWWQWHAREIRPEWVVIRTGATTLFGPVEGSTAHFKLPPGALTRQRSADRKGGWVELEYDGKSGWLKQEYIKRVSP